MGAALSNGNTSLGGTGHPHVRDTEAGDSSFPGPTVPLPNPQHSRWAPSRDSAALEQRGTCGSRARAVRGQRQTAAFRVRSRTLPPRCALRSRRFRTRKLFSGIALLGWTRGGPGVPTARWGEDGVPRHSMWKGNGEPRPKSCLHSQTCYGLFIDARNDSEYYKISLLHEILSNLMTSHWNP